MSKTDLDNTAAPVQSSRPAELDERELSQVAGGGAPATDVTLPSQKCPIVIVD